MKKLYVLAVLTVMVAFGMTSCITTGYGYGSAYQSEYLSSVSSAKEHALFLSDKMAYELDLTPEQ